MKKWTSLLSILIILLVFSGISHGVSNNRINVTMNGKKEIVTQVKVIKDGQVIEMEIPSFVYIDRTLVPVRMAETLGAKVDWNAETQTAIVTHNDKIINLTIDSDLASINGEDDKLDKNSIPRLITFDNKDTRTMIPLAYLSKMLGYDVGWDSEAQAAFINTKEEEKPEIKPENKPEENSTPVKTNKIKAVEKEIIDGQEAIVIYGSNKVKTNTMKLTNPQRIVVDLYDSTLNIEKDTTFFDFAYELEFIKGIRVSQFLPDENYKPEDKIVRFVLDIKEGVLDPEIKIDSYDNRIVIIPEKNMWENLNFNVDGKTRTIAIKNLIETNYSVEYDDLTKNMEISIPKDAINLVKGILPVKDNLIEELKVVEGLEETKLLIKFRRNIEYTILSGDIDDKIVLQILRNSDTKASDRIIVIDPGHGGIKPGSSSPNGVVEKDLNLKISLKLEKALKDLGYNIIMTRNDDSHIDLEDRSNVANNKFADIFVSVHANSFTKPDVNGIEVLYTPVDGDPIKDGLEKGLAKAVLDSLIKETGAVNRGLRKSPNLVVTRKSNMPAILVEVGFLSNAKEEKLITNDDYQEKLIKGIIKGIEVFFDEY